MVYRTHMQRHLVRARLFARLMDSQFSFLGYRFGLDPLLGLFPGLGDTLSLFLSLYILYISYQLNVSSPVLLQMVRNIVLDFLLGSIPVVGDVSDFVYKANLKNMELLEAHIPKHVDEGEVIS